VGTFVGLVFAMTVRMARRYTASSSAGRFVHNWWLLLWFYVGVAIVLVVVYFSEPDEEKKKRGARTVRRIMWRPVQDVMNAVDSSKPLLPNNIREFATFKLQMTLSKLAVFVYFGFCALALNAEVLVHLLHRLLIVNIVLVSLLFACGVILILMLRCFSRGGTWCSQTLRRAAETVLDWTVPDTGESHRQFFQACFGVWIGSLVLLVIIVCVDSENKQPSRQLSDMAALMLSFTLVFTLQPFSPRAFRRKCLNTVRLRHNLRESNDDELSDDDDHEAKHLEQQQQQQHRQRHHHNNNNSGNAGIQVQETADLLTTTQQLRLLQRTSDWGAHAPGSLDELNDLLQNTERPSMLLIILVFFAVIMFYLLSFATKDNSNYSNCLLNVADGFTIFPIVIYTLWQHYHEDAHHEDAGNDKEEDRHHHHRHHRESFHVYVNWVVLFFVFGGEFLNVYYTFFIDDYFWALLGQSAIFISGMGHFLVDCALFFRSSFQ
jgi:hypothetical protein